MTTSQQTSPETPDRTSEPASESTKKVVVSTAKVGASAGAAVTSALAASFFGSTGTLIGAAVGATVSTVASALYTEYLERAGKRLKTTTEVVIQRIPGEVLATTPLRHLTSPTDLPGEQSMRAVGDEDEPPGPESVTVPLAGRTELLEAAGEADRLPPVAGTGPSARTSPPTPVRRWARPGLALAGVPVAGFLIALGLILSTEQAIGRPLSGGESGNTLSNLGGNKAATTAPAVVTPSEAPSGPASGEATPAPEGTGAAVPSSPATPAGDGTQPTAQPTAGSQPGEGSQSDGDPSGDGDPESGDSQSGSGQEGPTTAP